MINSLQFSQKAYRKQEWIVANHSRWISTTSKLHRNPPSPVTKFLSFTKNVSLWWRAGKDSKRTLSLIRPRMLVMRSSLKLKTSCLLPLRIRQCWAKKVSWRYNIRRQCSLTTTMSTLITITEHNRYKRNQHWTSLNKPRKRKPYLTLSRWDSSKALARHKARNLIQFQSSSPWTVLTASRVLKLLSLKEFARPLKRANSKKPGPCVSKNQDSFEAN